MIPKFKILISGLILVLFFSTCKKHPENKFGQRVNPSKCLPGTWKYSACFINGADSTMQHLKVFNSSLINPEEITLNLEASTSNSRIFTGKIEPLDLQYYSSNCSCNSNLSIETIQINLNKDKHKIDLTGSFDQPAFFVQKPSLYVTSGSWEIRKLTKTEFHFECGINGKKYRFELKK